MNRPDFPALRRWWRRVGTLIASGVPFRKAVRIADVAHEVDRAAARRGVHPGRVTTGGAA